MVLFLRSELTEAFNRVIVDTLLPCFPNDWTELSIDRDNLLLVGMQSTLLKKVIDIMMSRDSPKNSLESHF